MDPSLKVMLFISIGGVTAFLPLMFIKKEKMTVKNISLMCGLFFGFSVMFSAVVAVGGNCSFLETLLMKGNQCSYLPFANTRTVPVTNTVAFVFFVLILIAVARDIVFKIIQKKK